MSPHLYEFGDGRFVSCLYTPTSDGRWVATYEDVTERRQAEAKIIHMARHDALTDLPNWCCSRISWNRPWRAATSSR